MKKHLFLLATLVLWASCALAAELPEFHPNMYKKLQSVKNEFAACINHNFKSLDNDDQKRVTIVLCLSDAMRSHGYDLSKTILAFESSRAQNGQYYLAACRIGMEELMDLAVPVVRNPEYNDFLVSVGAVHEDLGPQLNEIIAASRVVD